MPGSVQQKKKKLQKVRAQDVLIKSPACPKVSTDLDPDPVIFPADTMCKTL